MFLGQSFPAPPIDGMGMLNMPCPVKGHKHTLLGFLSRIQDSLMTYPGQCLLAFISVYVFTHKYAAQLQFFLLECYNYQAFLTSTSTVVVLQYAHLAVCPRDSSIDMFFTKQGEQNV